MNFQTHRNTPHQADRSCKTLDLSIPTHPFRGSLNRCPVKHHRWPHHSCRPLAILIERHRHAAVHDQPHLTSLAADPELAATLQPIIPLHEPGPRLEAQRHNTLASLADQRANNFVFRCQEPALVHGRVDRHRVGQHELGVRRAE